MSAALGPLPLASIARRAARAASYALFLPAWWLPSLVFVFWSRHVRRNGAIPPTADMERLAANEFAAILLLVGLACTAVHALTSFILTYAWPSPRSASPSCRALSSLASGALAVVLTGVSTLLLGDTTITVSFAIFGVVASTTLARRAFEF